MNRILAIDDAADTLMLLEFDLQSEGYEVTTASSGKEALSLLAEQKFDLILLDMYMPELNGLEVLKQIKCSERYSHLPVIMLSASDDENEIVSALELGANDYVTKPYIAKVLLARIKTSLRLREQALKLETLANTDSLTGLSNKGYFETQSKRVLRQLSRESGELAIAMLDIDHFKQVNDTFGHEVGDDVLALFAETMTTQFRDYDILGRVGGEEFAVCMPSISIEDAMSVCERLRAAVEGLNVVTEDQQVVNFTVSIGLVSVLHNGGVYDFQTLMRSADGFLYQAKQESRNCVRTHNIEHAVILDDALPTSAPEANNAEEQLPGIDYTIGVNNVLGDDDLYQDILQMFYDDHHLDKDKIQQAINANDEASIKHLVHTLKGVACSIGAMQLFDNSKALDVAVNEGKSGHYQSLFDNVAHELERVIAGIRAKLDS